MKKVLVTGGAGYIGSVLTRKLVTKGYDVRVFDRLVYGEESLRELQGEPNFELIRGDIRRQADLPDLLDGVDAIIHLASLSNDPSCDLKPQATLMTNYEAAMALAARAKDAGIERFVFASSCSTYGTGHITELNEESHLHPVSLYAECMVKCEKRLRELAGENGFCPVMLRQATVFGLSPRMRFDLAINVMTQHAVRNGKVFVLGGGRQWRPFVHVSDAADAFILALEAPAEKVCSEVFNVGSNDQNYQIIGLANLIKEVLPQTEVEVAPDDPDKRDYNVNFNKIARVLGFKAAYSARDGIEEVARAIKDGTLADLDDNRYYNLRLLKELESRPAIEGGEKVFFEFLPFGLPIVGREEEEEVLATLRSGWLTLGPKTKAFEAKMAEYLGAKHVVAVSSCTAALHLSLAALGVGPGDEVITTPVTFAATANVIVHQGARPVFVDVDESTMNIDVAKIREKITDRTRAIIPVHLAGRPCDMDEIRKIADERNIAVIEDAAHALGSYYKERKIGSLGNPACFSFYPIKNMTTIEGGVIATDDEELAERMRVMSLHGMNRDAWNRYGATGSRHYEVVYPGYKYNMTDVQASLGIHQLDKLDGFIHTRARYREIYDSAFRDLEQISIMPPVKNGVSSNHLYIIRIRPDRLNIDRDGFMDALAAENIGTGIHFISLHLHPYYREEFGYSPDDLPNARRVSETILSLPLYPRMEEESLFGVIEGVRKVARYYAK